MDVNEMKRRLAKGREARGRYAKALREAVVAHATEQRRQGVARERVAAELGMSIATLSYWCTPPKRKSVLSPVTIVSEPQPAREIVVAYGSLRVHGLDVGQVAELVRRLG
jgi:hypothetical protein